MFTSNNNNNNNSCVDNNMVVDGDEQQTMFENRPFENDISPSTYKLDNLSLSFFHFSPATFLDQDIDAAFFQYHSQLLQSVVVVDSPTDSITTTMAAADQDQQTQTTKLMAADDDNDPASSKLDLPPNNNNKVKTKSSSSSSTRKTPKRRLSGKKDRHSKIVTAQGTRDRRMRLSLPIAREFFNLQDMLGVDKPSKTVQWLLTMSKSAIEELTAITTLSHRRRNIISNKQYHTATGTGSASNCKSTTTGSSMSDCELVSEIEETVVTCNIQEQSTIRRRSADLSKKRKSLESSPSTTTTSNKGKKMKRSPPPPRKITYHHPLARESRAKARARARARTIEKMQGQTRFIEYNSKQCVRGQNLNNDLNKVRTSLTSSTTSKESEESAGSGTYDMKSTLEEMVSSTDEVMKYSSPSTEHQAGGLVKDNINVDLEESFMITTRKASSSSIFSYHDDIGLIASNNNNNNSTSVLNFSEMWDFFTNNNAGQTNSSYCGITDMNQLPAGNIQEYCLPSSSSIPLASPNTRLQSQFANLPLFCGKP